MLGEVVRLVQVPDDRPFLKRESLKRGTIPGVCGTKIQFAEARKLYDFFADDGSAVTLSDEDAGSASSPNPPDPAAKGDLEQDTEIGLNQDLTGKDLIQLIPSKLPGDNPSEASFDADDLKEGAYFIVRRRFKTSVAPDSGPGGMTATSAGPRNAFRNEVTVSAGTLGRIEKRAGFRSQPVWVAEILPDSVPRPFWRSLLEISKTFAPRPVLPIKVLLSSSDIVEINHFLDQYGVEWTRFGKPFDDSEPHKNTGTNQLPAVYAPPPLPLEENISIAQRARVLEAIQAAEMGLRLEFKDPATAARRTTVVLDDSDPGGRVIESSPHLLHRQCFIGLDKLANGDSKSGADARPATLRVTDVDIKIFQPSHGSQVPPEYYAIDLAFLLTSTLGAGDIPIVCRFPSAPINLTLEQMAERILSSRFEITRQKER